MYVPYDDCCKNDMIRTKLHKKVIPASSSKYESQKNNFKCIDLKVSIDTILRRQDADDLGNDDSVAVKKKKEALNKVNR